MGDYREAKKYYGKLLNILLSRIGKKNIYFANLLTYRGKLYHDQLKYSKAESLHKEAIEIHEKLHRCESYCIVAQSMTNLGKVI